MAARPPSRTDLRDAVRSVLALPRAVGRISAPASPYNKKKRRKPAPIGLALDNWRRLVPETLALIVLLALFDRLVSGGVSATTGPHPFWIPVLLMSAQYGAVGGVFATASATAAFYLIAPPPQLATQDFYTYAGTLLGQPVGWLAAALVIGGLRNLHMARAAELQESLEEARSTAETLDAGLDRAVAEIDRLECRIAGEMISLDGVIRALAALDARDVETLATSFANVVRDGTGATSFTLYLQGSAAITPAVRMIDGDTGSIWSAPVLPASLLETLGRAPRTIVQADAENSAVLPAGCLCVAPIISDAGPALLGLIVIERLSAGQDLAQAAIRAELLGRALGNIARAMFSRFRQPERAQQIGG